MTWQDLVSLASPKFYVPWIRFESPEGDQVDGPMLRAGAGRRELLAWTSLEGAEAAAKELISTTGGSFEIMTWNRHAVEKHCRKYSTWKSPVVPVFFKA